MTQIKLILKAWSKFNIIRIAYEGVLKQTELWKIP